MEGRACESDRATVKPLEVLSDQLIFQDTSGSCHWLLIFQYYVSITLTESENMKWGSIVFRSISN